MSHRLPLADIQFILDFAVFSRSKGEEAYDYCEPGNCAIAQFLRDTGRANEPWVSGHGRWCDLDKNEESECRQCPEGVSDACNSDEYWLGADTFSALADRLEALISDAPMVRS